MNYEPATTGIPRMCIGHCRLESPGGQVTAATGRDDAQARRDYRQWAEDEHRQWLDYNGEFGMDAAEHAAAIMRAAP